MLPPYHVHFPQHARRLAYVTSSACSSGVSCAKVPQKIFLNRPVLFLPVRIFCNTVLILPYDPVHFALLQAQFHHTAWRKHDFYLICTLFIGSKHFFFYKFRRIKRIMCVHLCRDNSLLPSQNIRVHLRRSQSLFLFPHPQKRLFNVTVMICSRILRYRFRHLRNFPFSYTGFAHSCQCTVQKSVAP